MRYSRRHFLKAAGSGAVVLTTVGGYRSVAVSAAPAQGSAGIAAPMTLEIGTFIINGATYQAEYEARTTLWEVIAMKLALTGTNRSCNRASCGACSVLIEGTPYYSCHTLATEARGKDIFTVGRPGRRRQSASDPGGGAPICGGRLRILYPGMGGDGERSAGRESGSDSG